MANDHSCTRAYHGLTVLNQVDRVLFTGNTYPIHAFKATNRDASTPLYIRFDAVDPTVAGADCFIVRTGETKDFFANGGLSEVRVVSGIAAAYSIEVMDGF